MMIRKRLDAFSSAQLNIVTLWSEKKAVVIQNRATIVVIFPY